MSSNLRQRASRDRGPDRSQRGAGRVSLVVTLAVVGFAVFAALRIIPIKVNTYEFTDQMRVEATRSAWDKDEAVLRKRILTKARELELPVTEKNLKIEITSGEVKVNAKYEIPVDLIFYTWVMKFDQTETAPLF